MKSNHSEEYNTLFLSGDHWVVRHGIYLVLSGLSLIMLLLFVVKRQYQSSGSMISVAKNMNKGEFMIKTKHSLVALDNNDRITISFRDAENNIRKIHANITSTVITDTAYFYGIRLLAHGNVSYENNAKEVNIAYKKNLFVIFFLHR